MGVMERMFRETMGLVEKTTLSEILSVPLAALVPRSQPRKRFEEAGLLALAESLRVHGVLEPLLVRPLAPPRDGKYEIVAGERRYRAAKMAGLETVPAIVLEADDHKAKTLALLENLQREDLNPYEETLGILDLLGLQLAKEPKEVVSLLYRLRDESRKKVPHNVMGSLEAQEIQALFGLLGKMSWESFVQNRLPLLNLPEELRQALEEGAIAYTVALELKKVKDLHLRRKLLEEAKAGLALRDLRAKVRHLLNAQKPPNPWYQEALSQLRRVRIEVLPEAKRKKAQELIEKLLKLLASK